MTHEFFVVDVDNARIDYLKRLVDVFSQVRLNIQITIWKESFVYNGFKRVFKFIHLSSDTVADDRGALIIIRG